MVKLMSKSFLENLVQVHFYFDPPYLNGAPGAGAAPDEVPQVGGQNALQDPLLVLPRRAARPVTADHTAR